MRRTHASGIVALGVHGAILLAVCLRRTSSPGESQPAVVTEIELESSPGSPGAAEEQPPVPEKPAHVATPRHAASDEGPREAPVASAAAAPPAAAASPADDGSWT